MSEKTLKTSITERRAFDEKKDTYFRFKKQKGPATLMGRPIIPMGEMTKFLETEMAEERVREICREMIQEARQETRTDKIREDPLFKKILAGIIRRRSPRKKEKGVKLQIIMPEWLLRDKEYQEFMKNQTDQIIKYFEVSDKYINPRFNKEKKW